MVQPGSYRSCRYCGHRFEERQQPGRKREYCSLGCRQQAQRERDGRVPVQPSPSLVGRPIAEDLQGLAAGLLAAEYGGQDLETLLRLAGNLAREVEHYAAAAVSDARSAGAGWEQVARAAQISVPTARTRWNDQEVMRRMKRRAADKAAVHDGDAGGQSVADTGQSAARAGRRLASALSYLHRTSGLTIREVAEETGLSASYVSRILSGERTPTWSVTSALATAFGGEPEQVSVLWESAHSMTPVARQPFPHQAGRLRSALWGLYLAAARPDTAHLCRICPGVLTPEVVEDLLSGDLLPDWETTGAFVSALGGWPADIRPLWEEAHYAFLLWVHPLPDAAVPGPQEPPDGARRT
ncbi:helix-turn-helix transcriptional regulator [Streptomyces sp. ISL-99]|uniref:helix-turn-helix domain-containing protein n=1 Tax=Streptomyces sp. ISL-99 TaxID=2819193 RepID=UPI001BEA5463|nr:helix-turn-helix transcriptional regulator [Streptomyces sp. ISL-99]MBT2529923.1 helix-turn-helix transcriptional regulator [Streptomyces sp. ISL-99]